MTKGLAFNVLDKMGPFMNDNYERFGYNRLVNETSSMKQAFNNIPRCYRVQIDSIMEDYDIITSSMKNQVDYLRMALLIGDENFTTT